MIYLQQTWVNDSGTVIYSRLPATSEPDTFPAPSFFALAQGMVPVGGPGQMAPIQIQFQIPGATVEEAFANYPAALETARKEAVTKAQAEYRKAMLTAGVGRIKGELRGK